jgi:hypothetical protein
LIKGKAARDIRKFVKWNRCLPAINAVEPNSERNWWRLENDS